MTVTDPVIRNIVPDDFDEFVDKFEIDKRTRAEMIAIIEGCAAKGLKLSPCDAHASALQIDAWHKLLKLQRRRKRYREKKESK